MPELLVEDYFKRAFDEGHLALRGEGKNERIVYTASNHSERWADREEKVGAAFFAELIYKYEYSPARIGLEIRVPRHIPGDLADLIVYSDEEHLQPFIVIRSEEHTSELQS